VARLVVISNRVALPTGDGASRAGGLEVAVRAALRRQSGIWFGWSGKIAAPEKVATETIRQDDLTFVVTDLTKEDYEEYYSGFANRVLWPILHYRLDLAEFSRRDLNGYLRVNEHFATELHKILRPDDVIWVHDYHLMPLAKALRERGHTNRIGFFLHIPLPPPDILAALPNHERLVGALSHYDLVGFQTESDVENFGRYLTKELHLPSRDQRTFTTPDRPVRIGAFPVGIETAEFGRLAHRAVRSTFVKDVLGSLGDRAMIIGVDRLDYSKGLPLRMEAFERFLEASPDWRGKVTYLQITPKSRSEIREYMDIDQAVGSAAGRINGTFGEASWTPIRYVNRAHSRTALAGLYRAARAALVTPLRDGMNLVAKEYVASQDPENPGVLILSRFAGAAVELDAALLVNPYDSESVAAAIAQALAMPLDERKARHEVMLHALAANDLKFWAERFLGTLTRPRPLPNWLRQVSSLVAM
jgi:trehalose 6-phosphate synthase